MLLLLLFLSNLRVCMSTSMTSIRCFNSLLKKVPKCRCRHKIKLNIYTMNVKEQRIYGCTARNGTMLTDLFRNNIVKWKIWETYDYPSEMMNRNADGMSVNSIKYLFLSSAISFFICKIEHYYDEARALTEMCREQSVKLLSLRWWNKR